jgi:two-component system sensor histidine kinase YesM
MTVRAKPTILAGTLFFRLMNYFLIVMVIPLALLSITYLTTGNRALVRNLSEQGILAADRAANRLKTVIESYRHKAYTLSTDAVIVAELGSDAPESRSGHSREIYERLFTIMKGDTYVASAAVVSSSGQVRYSTHLFPEIYDIRYNRNDWNPFFTLSRTASETASVSTTENRYATETNALVFLNIYRKVRDAEGTELGYVAVDVFQEAVTHLNDGFKFSDLILIDSSTFLATSLVNSDRHGDFSRFPELKTLSAPFIQRTIVDGSTIISLSPVPNTSLFIAGITDTTGYGQSIRYFFVIIIVLVFIGTLFAGLLAYFFTRSISNPVNRLTTSMQQVETGDLAVRIRESSIAEFAQLDRTFNAMVAQISGLLELTREEESKLREAERKALQSQMNPHFLYNTLNTVKALAKLHGEETILTITTQLGKLLRDSIDNHDAEQPLRQSIALVQAYLYIQKIRYGEKLQTTIDIDEHLLDLKVPKLLIQPLVENAIIHGLEPKIGLWRLSIKGRLVGNRAVITISDNGVGMSGGTLPFDLDDLAQTSHVGIYNIHRRLKLHFGQLGSLSFDSIEGEGTTVTLGFPGGLQ